MSGVVVGGGGGGGGASVCVPSLWWLLLRGTDGATELKRGAKGVVKRKRG